jgi:tetratricopeptide (TPR) repeat protein
MLRFANGVALSFKAQWTAAIAEAETAIAYDRNNAGAHQLAGHLKQWLGRTEDGIAGIETALRLSPHDGGVPLWQSYLCRGYSLLGRWEQAIERCEKAIAASTPAKPWVLVQLAGAYAWAGHDKEAKEAVTRLHDLDPNFTVQTYLTNANFYDEPTYKAQAARLAEGMSKAGLPEE